MAKSKAQLSVFYLKNEFEKYYWGTNKNYHNSFHFGTQNNPNTNKESKGGEYILITQHRIQHNSMDCIYIEANEANASWQNKIYMEN